MTLNIISTAATKGTCVKYMQIEITGENKIFTTIRNWINCIKECRKRKWGYTDIEEMTEAHFHQKP